MQFRGRGHTAQGRRMACRTGPRGGVVHAGFHPGRIVNSEFSTNSLRRDHGFRVPRAKGRFPSSRARPTSYELTQACDVALFGLDGSPPCLLVGPAGDRGLDEAAGFGGVECFGLPLSGRGRVQGVAGGERGPARVARLARRRGQPVLEHLLVGERDLFHGRPAAAPMKTTTPAASDHHRRRAQPAAPPQSGHGCRQPLPWPHLGPDRRRPPGRADSPGHPRPRTRAWCRRTPPARNHAGCYGPARRRDPARSTAAASPGRTRTPASHRSWPTP